MCRFMVINLSHAGKAEMLAFIPHLLLALSALQWVCLYWSLEVGGKKNSGIILEKKGLRKKQIKSITEGTIR